MTAICLLWRFEGVSDIRDDAGSMLSALRPYGADHQALWADGQVGMGRALYRTLPEDAYDRQPLSVAGGTAVLVADARLDNRDELAGLLDISTTDRAIMSDTDILVRAWERWGDDCVPRLLGDFAFIVWDARNQRVFCARDPLGRRPLHYHRAWEDEWIDPPTVPASANQCAAARICVWCAAPAAIPPTKTCRGRLTP